MFETNDQERNSCDRHPPSIWDVPFKGLYNKARQIFSVRLVSIDIVDKAQGKVEDLV